VTISQGTLSKPFLLVNLKAWGGFFGGDTPRLVATDGEERESFGASRRLLGNLNLIGESAEGNG
jgi:hypothetical protein